ncbi:MAG: hypothetical protein QXU32_09600 [Nitrososphaerales archaeon]
MKLAYLSSITTGFEAVATILSAVKVITFSIKSLASVPQNNTHDNTESRRDSGLGIHKWILIAGAVVGAITIAYLESIAANSRAKVKEPRQQQRLETVHVSE